MYIKVKFKKRPLFISSVLARELEQCTGLSRKWGLTCQRAAGRRAEFLDSASTEFPDVTNICASGVAKVPFAHLLRSGRPQVDPQEGNVTGFSCWVKELLCGQKFRLWVTSPGWFWVCSAASCAFTAGGTLACPATFLLKILAWRPRSHCVGMFVVWELHVVRTCCGRGGWCSESCPDWWWLELLWPQIAFRTWSHAVTGAGLGSFTCLVGRVSWPAARSDGFSLGFLRRTSRGLWSSPSHCVGRSGVSAGAPYGWAGNAWEVGELWGRTMKALLGCSRTVSVTPPAGQEHEEWKEGCSGNGSSKTFSEAA